MASKLFMGRESRSDGEAALAAARENAFYQASRHIGDGKQYRITCFGAFITETPSDKTGYFHAECELCLREEIEASREDAYAATRDRITQKALAEIKSVIEKAEGMITTNKIGEKG